MFHREAGTFKTSYAKDMALFPLPIANYVAMALVAGALAMVIGVCVVARRQAEPPHSGAPAVARPLPPA